MEENSEGSFGDKVGQLLVIVILIAILIGAIILLENFIHDHTNSATASQSSFSYSCCTGLNGAVTYHPGQVLHLTWTPSKNPSSANPAATLTFTAFLSNSFASPSQLKSSTESIHYSKERGFPDSASAHQFHLSNQKGEPITMSIQIPKSALSGYYDLVTVVGEKHMSSTGETMIKVRR